MTFPLRFEVVAVFALMLALLFLGVVFVVLIFVLFVVVHVFPAIGEARVT